MVFSKALGILIYSEALPCTLVVINFVIHLVGDPFVPISPKHLHSKTVRARDLKF